MIPPDDQDDLVLAQGPEINIFLIKKSSDKADLDFFFFEPVQSLPAVALENRNGDSRVVRDKALVR